MGFVFNVLGPLEVLSDGVPVEITASRHRALVAALVLDGNRVVPVESLIGRVWGDRPPHGARNALKNYVLRVRRRLGEPSPLLSHAQGYLMRVDPEALDLDRFETLVGRAEAADRPAEAADLLRQALGLWRGAPVPELGSEPLREQVQARWAERRLCAVEARVDAELALGRYADVLAELRELTAEHPLRERLWGRLMLALYRSGRPGEALECYHRVAALLAEELGVDPGPELRDLHQRILVTDPALGAGERLDRPRVAGNLPAETTSFVGRGPELRQAAHLLGQARLVTMTGAGGAGKTRLALRAAARAAPAFPDGAWWADLSALTEPGLLALAVAEALGIRDQSARGWTRVLADHLRDRRLLLVLDNCEHLVPEVTALVTALLPAAGGLVVLATSRHRLGLADEHVLPVPALTEAEAVELFAQRGRASAPDFRVGPRNRDAVDRLCRRLDRIPLAIELAAVRMDTLSVTQISDRLDDRFELLSDGGDPRRTLRGVLEWSHGLCTRPEQALWARLSVFAGGFDLAAAEAVCADPTDATDATDPAGPADATGRHRVLDLLSGLVRKSLLTADTGADPARYRMLETVRQYGHERLRRIGRETALRVRHRDHFLEVAARAAAQWCGPRDHQWLSLLLQDLPNLRAAMEFSLAEPGHAPFGLRLAVDLSRAQLWLFGATPAEGRRWLEGALAAQPGPPCPVRARAAAFVTWLALCQGDRDGADAALAACRGLDDGSPGSSAARAVAEGAHTLLALGDPRSIALLADARGHFRRAGQMGEQHWATLLWTMAAAFLGDRDRALHAAREYLAEADHHGGRWTRSWARWGMGLAQMRHGDRDLATRLIQEAIAGQRELDDTWSPTWGVELLAWNLCLTGEAERAALLLGAAHRLRRSLGVTLYGPFLKAHDDTVRHLRQALGEAAYSDAHRRGATASDPLELALGS
ncbi:BTAD domain-containing putative transcriptional regulator [Actinomadura kijaniata]|uniref:BTAD domain-containing putative transcriptional regulator n=1 Tax=Actinomadura kijaniata TaxID=46161 RepID=UPI0008350C6F|nr:BTAD domain-containing putative transcriptional regulator [Actinomadura kijaniata]